MSADTASRGRAAVPLRCFHIVLFLVAVPPPFPFHFGDIFLFRVLMFSLPPAVLGVIVFKSVRWKKFPHEVAQLHNPWVIMTLMLATGPGIMHVMSMLFLFCFFGSLYLYCLPLCSVLGYVIYMAFRRQARRPGDILSWPQNPWLRILLVITGLPAAASYLASGFFVLLFALADLVGRPLMRGFCLAGLIAYAGLVVYAFYCMRKDQQGEERRKTLWLSLLVRIVGLGLLACVTFMLETAILTADKAVQAWLSPLWGCLPVLFSVFSVYKAMTWRQRPQA